MLIFLSISGLAFSGLDINFIALVAPSLKYSQDMGLAVPTVPLMAFRNALLELRSKTAWGFHRALCYECLRNTASEMTLGGRDGTAPRRKAFLKRSLHMQKPVLRFDRAMATVSHCRNA